MKQKLLLFDLDGTIADTIWSIRDGVNMALSAFGYPSRDYEQIRLAIGNGARELIRRSLPPSEAQNEALVDRVLQEYDRAYGLTYDRADKCYDGIRESFAILRQRGYLISILSNKQDLYVKKIASALFPDDTISLSMGQTEHLPKKPDPTVPLMMAAQLGADPSDSAFIGDSDVDIITAKNAGMYAVGCAWGYRGKEILRQAGADVVLNTPWELTDIFR